jgi:hypothetical protein
MLGSTSFIHRECIQSLEDKDITGEPQKFPGISLKNHPNTLKLKFKKPKRIDIIGSFMLQTGILIFQVKYSLDSLKILMI